MSKISSDSSRAAAQGNPEISSVHFNVLPAYASRRPAHAVIGIEIQRPGVPCAGGSGDRAGYLYLAASCRVIYGTSSVGVGVSPRHVDGSAVKVYYRILHSRLCSDLSPVAPTGGRGSPRNDLVWPRGKGSSLLSPKKPEPLKRIASLPPNSMLDYTSKPFESPRGKSALMGSLKTIKSLLGEKRRNESPSSPRTVIFPSNLEDQLCVFMLPSQLSTD